MKWELLQQVNWLDPHQSQPSGTRVDVLLERIAEGVYHLEAIAPALQDIPSDTLVFDAQGWFLGPSLVDLYSQCGEPGFEDRETLQSLRQAALSGGFAQVNLLPTTVPPLDTPALIEKLQQPLAGSGTLRCWAALSQGCQGQRMTEFADLVAAGCVGFTDNAPLSDWVFLQRTLEYLHPWQTPIALWPAHPAWPGSGKARDGYYALQLGLSPLSPLSETLPLAAILECVALTRTPVHLMRISTARGVELIAQAKAQGLPITASTTWMHLLWDIRDLHRYDTHLNLNPPLGNPTDQAALIHGLETGVLDAIAVDHTPHTYEEKQVGFAQSPPGVIGLELALSALWQAFVASDRWSPRELWNKLSLGATRCLQQSTPELIPGQPVQLTLFDPQQTWVADRSTLKSRSLNTPYLNCTMQGKVIKVYSDR